MENLLQQEPALVAVSREGIGEYATVGEGEIIIDVRAYDQNAGIVGTIFVDALVVWNGGSQSVECVEVGFFDTAVKFANGVDEDTLIRK